MSEIEQSAPNPNANTNTVAPDWAAIENFISSLSSEQKPSRLKLIHDIFRSAVKLAKENPGTLNLKITSTTLRELRFSFRTFSPHRHTPKITIFGSARVPPEAPLYEFTRAFAEKAVQRKYMIVTGGGPGIMAAGNHGAGESGFGLNIKLPFEQTANPYIDPRSKLVNYKYFFTRKLFLVKEASAFAFLPGGFGTFDEAFEVLTLLQTGKTNLIPVIFLEPKNFGYWTGLMNFVNEHLLNKGFISPNDKDLFRVLHTAEDALDHIDHFYSSYHSMRFVKDRVVIRLKKPLSAALLGNINKDFSPLSHGGKFEQTAPLEEEGNEPELISLSRLVFPCDRKDFAGIRRLIDYINDHSA